MLKRLTSAHVRCTYVLLSALSTVITEANLVLLGADGVLANGNVLVRLGTSQVALCAHVNHIPVLAACQTYKFSEKVLTGTLDTAHGGQSFQAPLEMVEAECVSAIVCELRILPCNAAPAIMKRNLLQNMPD